MRATVRRVDHVAFGAGDLDEAQRLFVRLGFRPTPRGRCEWPLPGADFAAGSVSVMFAETYLDVIEIADPRWRTALAGRTLAAGALGPSGLVLGAADLAAALAAARGAGLACGEPYEIGRAVADPEGGAPRRMRYRIARVEPAERALPPLLVVENLTPEAMREPAWLEHPNGAVGLACAVYHAPETGPAARASRALLGASAVSETPAEVRAATATAELRFARESEDPFLRGLAASAPRPELPFCLALGFRTRDLAGARRALGEGGVPFAESGSGGARRLRVRPEHACGCAVEFGEGAAA
jgi:catechol 2,3-dioxygenase-like lactoylglutathione lyase family enzyme